MVRILANGEVVPDNDPRARQTTSRRTPQTQTRMGNVQHQQRENQGAVQQVNIFSSINQRLLAFGIPRWNIGQTAVEPIVSVGFLLALTFFGLPGVLFGGVIFAVSHWSQNGPPEFLSGILGGRNNDGTGRGDRRPNSGGGHRLGNN